MCVEIKALKERILAARGEIPADLVLKKGRVINVFSGQTQQCDVACHDGFIVGLGPEYRGVEEADLNGKWVIPGLIDGHMHIESSMLLPSRLAAALLPHGTTTIISDPHEIANVKGIDGIRFMLKDSAALPLDIFFMAPSCVPATHLETSGAQLDASELAQLRKEPKVLGLAEMMNFPGVLGGVPEVLKKLTLFKDRVIDGHGPSLTGYELQAYLSAGIRSDHETCDASEGKEKLESGMRIMIREGTSAKNLERLLPLVTPANARRFCLVSDDLHPRDIFQKGHLDFIMGKAIRLGLKPVLAIQMASLNPAEYFGLKDRGAVAPGYRADLAVLSDLENVVVDEVYKDGKLMVQEGKVVDFPHPYEEDVDRDAMKISPLTPESFFIRNEGKEVRVIELTPGEILTRVAFENMKSENGWIVSDTDADILKLAVVERHRASGRVGLGLVRGFGLNQGALASSVAHDAHNVIAVGVRDQDLRRAVQEVKEMDGGMVVIGEGKVLARVPLDVAGLMSKHPLDILVKELDALGEAARSVGCPLDEPFMSLSFLALPVIPELRLTDMGLVHVRSFSLVPLFTDQERVSLKEKPHI